MTAWSVRRSVHDTVTQCPAPPHTRDPSPVAAMYWWLTHPTCALTTKACGLSTWRQTSCNDRGARHE
eukprot:1349158-Prymnesium_polylepis.1